ncbi:MAG: TasA family protein [Candidatus Coproplasma sp.]
MNKSKLKNLIKLIVACVVAVAFTVVAVIFFVQDNAFAWFAKNNQVSASGMSATVKSDYDVTLTASASTELSALYPGQSATVTLTFKNNEAEQLKADIYLTVGAEVPITENGNYYYFGSQIKVTAVEATATFQSAEKDFFLMTTEVKNSGQVSYVTEPKTATDQLLVTGLELPAEYTVTVTITFTFIDNGDDQSKYINFGNSSGSCSRGILAVLA